jgi:predicted solute-binding protein
MSKSEQKYKYLLNKDKYDSKVVQAVGKKSISHSDANKINAIQEMMQKEKNMRKENMSDYVSNEISKKYNKE